MHSARFGSRSNAQKCTYFTSRILHNIKSNFKTTTKGHVSMGTNMYNCLTSQNLTTGRHMDPSRLNVAIISIPARRCSPFSIGVLKTDDSEKLTVDAGMEAYK
jgi:hypothetical protein